MGISIIYLTFIECVQLYMLQQNAFKFMIVACTVLNTFKIKHGFDN